MKNRTLIISAVIAILGFGLLAYALYGRATVGAARTLNLNEFGVALEIPGTLSDLTYSPRDESEAGPGTVLHMYTGSGCDLGAMYQIRKNAIAESNTTWTKETLEQFQIPQGDKPAQIKEFTDFYLVFEPNPDLCSTDEDERVEEAEKQKDLWNALTTAHFMQY
ncbi:MAG: hypothetical protein KBD06_02675 [Candidatus Pacebacteria bacterium]|nr:hypothetical protein [Candidatus Paceibacterota bacterium]